MAAASSAVRSADSGGTPTPRSVASVKAPTSSAARSALAMAAFLPSIAHQGKMSRSDHGPPAAASLPWPGSDERVVANDKELPHVHRTEQSHRPPLVPRHHH